MSQKSRAYHLYNKYGLTLDQYNELFEKQHFRCAVCKRHQSEFQKALSVDHDHVTGEIRGLLCTYCNRYRVGRHRDPEMLQRVVDYLKQGTGLFVPKRKRKKNVKR